MGGSLRNTGILALALAVLLWALPAGAQTLEEAIAEFQAGDVTQAVRTWEELAREGDADALFNLGQVYRLGAGAAADMKRAVGYYQQAAGFGHTPARRELGKLYAFNPAFGADRARGVELLTSAARAGDPEAQYLLGAVYIGGDLAPRDKIAAYAWTRLAREGGEARAAPMLLAMKGELSDNQLADAFQLSRTLITAPYSAAPHTLLVGEGPVPRRFAGASPPQPQVLQQAAEASPAAENEPEGGAAEPEEKPPVKTEAGAGEAAAPPLDLPDNRQPPARTALSEVVGEAQPLESGSGGQAAAETAEADSPEVMPAEPEPAPAPTDEAQDAAAGEATETHGEPAETTGDETAGEPEQQTGEVGGSESLDLGDPDSPLVDEDGFGEAFSVQLASFRTPEKAEEQWQALVDEAGDLVSGFEKRILRFDLGPELGVRYRLRIGPFADKEAADAACASLTEAGFGCLVIWP